MLIPVHGGSGFYSISHQKFLYSMQKAGYLIIDIGTGNVRVAITDSAGTVVEIARDDVHYIMDDPELGAMHFDPAILWAQIRQLTKQVLAAVPGIQILAITSSSQREGVVLIDKQGKAVIGFPNHDHRGRKIEGALSQRDTAFIYQKAGRMPGSLFSAFKVLAWQKEFPEDFKQMDKMVSISDWATYELTGVLSYEHAQASETLVYSVGEQSWSRVLCDLMDFPYDLLPDLRLSGSKLGHVRPVLLAELGLLDHSASAIVLVGGADTQLALKSTQPALGDIAVVSGTTTPIVMVSDRFLTDPACRTWSNRHVVAEQFILEANAGVTGLNYQRLKEIFYPRESYEVIAEELNAFAASLSATETGQLWPAPVTASLGSLIAQEDLPLTKGGFTFQVPVSNTLSRAQFIWAALWDIACCIKENLDVLCSVAPYDKNYIWGCSGGMQSKLLRQFIANLTGKEIWLRSRHTQASVIGGAIICGEVLGNRDFEDSRIEKTLPEADPQYKAYYQQWKAGRMHLKAVHNGAT